MSIAAGREARGLALIALSTVAYGVQPILGKAAYAAGVAPLTLLAWRYAIALVCLRLIERGPRPPLRARLRLWAIGAVFVVNSIAYFMALERLPASVTALVLFSYPVLVALLAAATGTEPLTWRALAAALLAFAGCGLTAGGLRQGGALPGGGVAWALAAAVVYASFVVLGGRFGKDVPARVFALHLLQVAALACGLLALVGPGLALPRDPRAWLSVAAIAVLSTVVSMVAFLAGMALVGPSRAAVLSSLEVLVTLALAFLLLDERLSPPQWAGALLILGAVAFQNLAVLRRLLRRGSVAATALLAAAPLAAADSRPPAQAAAKPPALTTARAEALVREVSATVERLRGLRFKEPVAVEVVDGATARKEFEAELDEAARARLGHMQAAWVHLGLVPAGTDLVAARLETAEKDVAGYYQSGTRKFRLLSHVSELELRSVMAHELTHALEDQHIDLEALQKRATSEDHAVAIRAVVEGSAMVTTLSVLQRQGGIGKAKEAAALASRKRATSVQGAPTFVQMRLLVPYTLGFSFLFRGKPWELLFDGIRREDIERAYAEPPHSTKEILHPEQYWGVRREPARSLDLTDLSPVLGPGWSRVLTGSIGELGLTLLTGSELKTGGFQMLLPTSWTTPGATGIVADAYHHYAGGERRVTVLFTRWESVRDADEFQRTLRGTRKTGFRFGANLLLMMGDIGDRGEALAAESVKGIKYWAGE
jgi:drug/metabolite transporter (DMT)-like permease